MKKLSLLLLSTLIFVSFSQAVSLQPGWNLISVGERTPLSEIQSECNQGFAAYNYRPSSQSYRNLGTLQPSKGYWINSDTSCSYSTGSTQWETLSLDSAGWHMISGSASLNTQDIRKKCNLGSPFYGFNPGEGYYEAQNMDSQKGYWIYLSEPFSNIGVIGSACSKPGERKALSDGDDDQKDFRLCTNGEWVENSCPDAYELNNQFVCEPPSDSSDGDSSDGGSQETSVNLEDDRIYAEGYGKSGEYSIEDSAWVTFGHESQEEIERQITLGIGAGQGGDSRSCVNKIKCEIGSMVEVSDGEEIQARLTVTAGEKTRSEFFTFRNDLDSSGPSDSTSSTDSSSGEWRFDWINVPEENRGKFTLNGKDFEYGIVQEPPHENFDSPRVTYNVLVQSEEANLGDKSYHIALKRKLPGGQWRTINIDWNTRAAHKCKDGENDCWGYWDPVVVDTSSMNSGEELKLGFEFTSVKGDSVLSPDEVETSYTR